MFLEILKFEVAFQRRQPMPYILAGIFFLLTFGATTVENITIGGNNSNLNINAPFVIVTTLALVSIFGLFAVIAFASGPVLRDFKHQTAELFLSTGVSKISYIYGRFLGAFAFAMLVYFGAMLGIMVGEFMPWLDQERIGGFSFAPYFFAMWAIAIPNLFICASVFFCLATVTRNEMSVYVGAVAFLMLSFVISYFTEPDTVALTSKLDPFGVVALGELMRYWTVFDKNERIPELAGDLLINRALWMAIALAFLALSYRLFPFTVQRRTWRLFKRKKKQKEEPATSPIASRPIVKPVFDAKTRLQQYLSQTAIEMRNIITSIPFVVLLVFGVFNVVASAAGSLGNFFGTPVYPSTNILIMLINGTFSFSLLFILVYYSSELLVREKDSKINEIMDSMPYPNWIMMSAKFSGLLLVVVAMILVSILAGMGVQVFKGYYQFEIGRYLIGLLFFFQFPLYFMCILAIFFQVLMRNKYLGMLLMIVYFILLLALPQLGYEHYLYRLSPPRVVYSDFTGYGHFLAPHLWYTLYWSFFGGALLVLTHLLWNRGTDDVSSARWRLLRQRFTPAVGMILMVLVVGFAATGGFIYYNTNILNDYVTTLETEERQAEYEKKFKQYEFRTAPKIQAIYAEVDIFPASRDARLSGNYQMVNDSGVDISDIHFTIDPDVDILRLEVPGSELVSTDDDFGYRVYRFASPLKPGDQLTVEFETEWTTRGFKNNGDTTSLLENGTFFYNYDMFPMVGYQGFGELIDNTKRKKYGLDPVDRMDDIDDEAAWMRSGLTTAGRIDFETVVSTSADQIAVAPGYLQREWTEGDRRFFHYKMDAPIWNFFSYLSADYEVKKAKWQDVDIEVYYIHGINVDTMIRSVQHALAYFTENFSAYQYRQFRILEFPFYRGLFAQSFPNTIPFSEGIGFSADLRDKEKIDYVFYVTAHELAHQWWAHQVIGADVQGSTMIVETLAQYSALMVMEKEYGAEHMVRFLRYELDSYLRGRGGELLEELPLMLVENQQYIHYRKGSVVLYALQDYIGEDAVNRALRKFIEDYAFKGPPYPTTRHLLANIRAEAPAEYQEVITDLFEKIVLYDLKVVDSSVTSLANGDYEVNFEISARKFEADGEGRETEVPISGYFDIAVLGEERGESKIPQLLHLEKRFIDENRKSFTIVVDKEPVKVGIDPLNKLIDRDPSDNTATIET